MSFKPHLRFELCEGRIVKMKLFLILLVSGFACAGQNWTVVEQACRHCTADGTKMYLKIIYQPLSSPEFVCRSSAVLISKFGIIVDRSCRPDQCENIFSRPITRTFSKLELACMDIEDSTTSYHFQILTIVREYLEIILMSTILGLLLLKKSILETCIKKRTENAMGEIISEADEEQGSSL
jgi:hypothetical protein